MDFYELIRLEKYYICGAYFLFGQFDCAVKLHAGGVQLLLVTLSHLLQLHGVSVL